MNHIMPPELHVPTSEIEVDHQVGELIKELGLGSEDHHAKHIGNHEVVEVKPEFENLLKKLGLDAGSSKNEPIVLPKIKKAYALLI